MKRRSFLQYVLGIFGVGATDLPKVTKPTDVIVANDMEPVQEWEQPLTCKWIGRKFIFEGRRIKWSEPGEFDNFLKHSYMDLPVVGAIWKVAPLDYANVLGLLVGNEEWLLRPLCDNDLVVQAECISKDYRIRMIGWGRWEGVRHIETL